MSGFYSRVMAGCALLALLVATSQAALTRFEAEITHTPAGTGDLVGYDFTNGNFWGTFTDAQLGETGNSNAKVVYSTIDGAQMKICFVGTGANIIVRTAGNGGTFNWSLDNGAQTGSGNTAGALQHQVSIPLVSGLQLTLHTIEIISTVGLSGAALFIDAFDIENSNVRTRVENDSASIVYDAGLWGGPDSTFAANTEASGGSIHYSISSGAKFTYAFNGSAVALIVAPRQDGRPLNWDIDGGARTGSFNLRDIAVTGHVAGGIWYRYPYLLANDLTDGPHTLTATVGNGPGTNFIVLLDAIDTVSAGALPVELSTFDAE